MSPHVPGKLYGIFKTIIRALRYTMTRVHPCVIPSYFAKFGTSGPQVFPNNMNYSITRNPWSLLPSTPLSMHVANPYASPSSYSSWHVFLTHIYTRRSPGPLRLYVYCTMRPFFSLFFVYKFYCPAQLIGGFSLSDLLDKSWSQVTSLLPPGTCLQFLSRVWFNIPTARRSSSNVANSRSRDFR